MGRLPFPLLLGVGSSVFTYLTALDFVLDFTFYLPSFSILRIGIDPLHSFFLHLAAGLRIRYVLSAAGWGLTQQVLNCCSPRMDTFTLPL